MTRRGVIVAPVVRVSAVDRARRVELEAVAQPAG
jgi:hypothetical protein